MACFQSAKELLKKLPQARMFFFRNQSRQMRACIKPHCYPPFRHAEPVARVEFDLRTQTEAQAAQLLKRIQQGDFPLSQFPGH